MKQPEIFKHWRKTWEYPLDFVPINEDELDRLRDNALDAISRYKEYKNMLNKREKERQEMLKFFEELDKISDS
jgi:hypothetical protein